MFLVWTTCFLYFLSAFPVYSFKKRRLVQSSLRSHSHLTDFSSSSSSFSSSWVWLSGSSSSPFCPALRFFLPLRPSLSLLTDGGSDGWERQQWSWPLLDTLMSHSKTSHTLTGSDCCARAVSHLNTLKQTVSMSVCVCRCPTCLHGAGLPVVTVTGVALLLALRVWHKVAPLGSRPLPPTTTPLSVRHNFPPATCEAPAVGFEPSTHLGASCSPPRSSSCWSEW